MAISYIGGRTQGFAGTTSTVSVSLTGLTGGFDTAPSAGDFVAVFYGVGSNVTTRAITIGASEGWTSLTKINADDTVDTNYVVAYKRMGSTPDTSVTVSGTGSTADAGAVVVHVFRGVDETTPLDVAAVSATGSNTSLANPAAITPVTSGAIIIASAATGHAGGTSSFFSPELFNFRSVGSNDTYDVAVGAGWTDWTSGEFDPAAFSWTGTDSTNNSWAAYTLALRPGPEPDPPTPTGGISFVGRTSARSLAGLAGGSDPTPLAGDLVLIYMAANKDGQASLSVDTAGYTQLDPLYSDNVTDTTLRIAYKFMGETVDRSYTYTGDGDVNAAITQVFRGVDPDAPFDVSIVSATGSGNAFADPPSITPTTSGAFIAAVGATSTPSFTGFSTISGPSNMVDQFGGNFANADTTRFMPLRAGHQPWTSGSFDPAAITSSGSISADSSWAAYTLALRPAPIPGVAVDPDDIATAAPVLGSPTVAQAHSLTPAAIVTGAVVLGAAALSQGHVLDGQGIVTGAPEVGQAALAQAHALAPNGLVTGSPALGSPAIAVEGVVSPESLETGSPVLGPPVLAQTHSFVVVDLALDNPVLGNFVVSEDATVLKYWDGAIWANGLVKRFDGVDWVNTKLKRFNGSSWT